MSKLNLVNFIKTYSLFGIVPEPIIEQSFTGLARQTFPARALILKTYQKNEHLYLVLKGQVRVIAEDERGIKVDLDYLKPGDCFGEMHLLSGDPQPFYIEALTETELLLIDKALLITLLQQFPQLYTTFYQILLRRLHHISRMKEQEIKEELEVISSDVVVTSRLLQRKEEILKFLDEINLLLDSDRSFGKLLETLTHRVAAHFKLPLCAIFLEVWGKDFFWLQTLNEKIFKGGFHQEILTSDPILKHLGQQHKVLYLETNKMPAEFQTSVLSQNQDFNHFFFFPIFDRGKFTAFILIADGKPLQDLKEIEETLDLFAGHLAAKIYQVQLAKEGRERKVELISLHKISKKLLASTNLEELLFEMVKNAAEVIRAKGCVLRLVDKKAETLKIAAYWGIGKDIADTATQKVGVGVAGWVAANKKSLIINDISADPRFENNIKTIAKSLLVVPLVNQEEVLGTLTVFDKDTRQGIDSHEFDEDDLSLMETFSTQASIAIVNARLRLEADSSLAMMQEKFQDKVGLLGESQKINHFNRKLFEAAQNDAAVLIHSEQGNGKLYAAQCLHNLGPRRNNVFVNYDCGSLLPENWGDEIFGFFNPQSKDAQKGLLEKAEGGTLVLKNIELMPYSCQTKLAHFLKVKKYHKVGASSEHTADVKIVVTTIAQLDQLVKERKFEPALFNILTQQLLIIPPLRTRKRDISLLIKDILKSINQQTHKNIATVTPEALGLLLNYDWPGNVQELYNVLERGVLLSKTEKLEAEHIFFGLPTAEGKKHFNLLRFDWVMALFKSKIFPGIFSVPTTLAFILIVFFAFSAPERSETNPAIIISWYIGWPLLFLSLTFLGRIWCSVCPFSAIARVIQKIFSLDKPVPEFIKDQDHWIMSIFCLVIVWFEEVTNIYSSPWITGALTLFIFAGAVLFSLIYSRSAWCRYICPWGALNGTFAQSSLLALRSNRNICLTQCKTYDCFTGGKAAPGCPMFGHPYSQDSNRNCIMCGNCIKNCPNQSILLSIRQLPFELWQKSRPLCGISLLCISLALTFLLKLSFHPYILPPLQEMFPALPYSATILYTLSFCLTILVSYWILLGMDYLLKPGLKLPRHHILRNLGYAWLPIALAGYLAYFLKMFFTKSPWLLPALKNFWDHTPLPQTVTPLLNMKQLDHLAILLITFNLIVSLIATHEILNQADVNKVLPFWKKAIPFTLILATGIGYLILS